MTDGVFRTPPALTNLNRAFWLGGAEGRLLIHRCSDCGFWLHPPAPVCRRCHSIAVAPAAVSGRGTLHSFSVNHQRWGPDDVEPYVIALVELAEQPGLNLLTNIVECLPSEVRIGMAVEVVFRPLADVWLPLFKPYSAA